MDKILVDIRNEGLGMFFPKQDTVTLEELLGALRDADSELSHQEEYYEEKIDNLKRYIEINLNEKVEEDPYDKWMDRKLMED